MPLAMLWSAVSNLSCNALVQRGVMAFTPRRRGLAAGGGVALAIACALRSSRGLFVTLGLFQSGC